MRKIFTLLAGAFCLAAMAQTSPYQGVAPSDIVSGNSYYLYNVNFQRWLGDNDRNTAYGWTSHAEIGDRGRDIAFYAQDGGYKLDPKMGNNHSINGHNLYMDTGDGVTIWHFDPIDGNVSNAVRVYANNGQLGVNQWGDMDNAIGDNNVWQIVTAAERWAVAEATATPESPVNVSWAVLGGTFPVACDHRGNGTWQGDKGSNASGGDAFYHCNRVWEFWGIANRNVYQTISAPNGKYILGGRAIYVSTGNDGVNYDRYNDYLNGTQGTMGYLYANEAQTPMRNLYDYLTNERVNDRNTRDIGNGKWAFQGTNEYSTNMFEGKGEVEQVEFTVTSNNITIGFKVENGTGNSWILINNIDLWYAGKINDLSAFIDMLEADIEEAEGLNTSETSEAARAALATALTAAKDELDSADQTQESLYDAIAALETAIKAVKEVNITYITRCIAFYTELDSKYTSEALTNARAARENAMTRGEIQNAADALILDYRIYVADKSEKPAEFAIPIETTDNVNATGGEYYLYNVGTGRWFCGGDDWGAHAAVGFPGIEVTVEDDNFGDGHYNKINTHLCNGAWNTSCILNNGGYCDTGGNAWKFWPQGNGLYTISRNGDNTGNNTNNAFGTELLLGFSTGTYMRVDTDKAGADNPYNQWMFVTKAQRNAAMAAATEEAPVDVTYLVGMPGFNQRERVAGTNQGAERLPWTCNHENYTYDNQAYDYGNINAHRHIICERGANHPDFAVDIYDWEEFSLSQDVAVPAEGAYRVRVQGFYRDGNEADKADPTLAAVLRANDAEVEIRAINSEPTLPWLDGHYPDNTWQAVDAFQQGLYWNVTPAVYVTDGTINIAVEKLTQPSKSDNLLFDNFRLEYLGAYDFGVVPVEVTVHSDKSATIECNVSHKLAAERGIDHYEMWVVDLGYQPQANRAPAVGDGIIGASDYTVADFDGGKVTITTDKLASNQQHKVVVRAKAVLADDTAIYSSARAEDDPEGSTGENALTIDTNLTGVQAVDAETGDDVIYNLQGIRVSDVTVPGIYIRNGQKVVIK